MKNLVVFTGFITTLTFGYFCGWAGAHDEIAAECTRQGGFYVGEQDFKCAPVRGGEVEQ